MKDSIRIGVISIAVISMIFLLVVSAKTIAASRNPDSAYATDPTLSNTVRGTAASDTALQAGQGQVTQAASSSPAQADSIQTATLKVVGSTYILTPSVFKKGVPVRITADISQMPGCSKSFTIRDFGINKYLTDSDNTIEFTPTSSGTFTMACSMNMYRGTFSVTDDGSAPTGAAAVQAQAVATKATSSPGGSCGAGGAGCGCGG